MRSFIAVLLPLLTFCACGGGSGGGASIEETEFAPELGGDLNASTKLGNGEYIRDLEVGSGVAITSNPAISIRYTGWLSDGRSFDSTECDGGKPYTFIYGQNKVIAGLEQGLVDMKRGGTRQLIVPPALGYGGARCGRGDPSEFDFGLPNHSPPIIEPSLFRTLRQAGARTILAVGSTASLEHRSFFDLRAVAAFTSQALHSVGHRHQPLCEEVAALALRAEAALAPENEGPQLALSVIVGGLDAILFDEGPQRSSMLENICARARELSAPWHRRSANNRTVVTDHRS